MKRIREGFYGVRSPTFSWPYVGVSTDFGVYKIREDGVIGEQLAGPPAWPADPLIPGNFPTWPTQHTHISLDPQGRVGPGAIVRAHRQDASSGSPLIAVWDWSGSGNVAVLEVPAASSLLGPVWDELAAELWFVIRDAATGKAGVFRTGPDLLLAGGEAPAAEQVGAWSSVKPIAEMWLTDASAIATVGRHPPTWPLFYPPVEALVWPRSGGGPPVKVPYTTDAYDYYCQSSGGVPIGSGSFRVNIGTGSVTRTTFTGASVLELLTWPEDGPSYNEQTQAVVLPSGQLWAGAFDEAAANRWLESPLQMASWPPYAAEDWLKVPTHDIDIQWVWPLRTS